MSWQSPIYIAEKVTENFENAIYQAVCDVGITVDREELLKALAYDRQQYRAGYADGYKDAKNDIVRCGECKHLSPTGECLEFADAALRPSASDFCSYAERRGDGECTE